MTFILLPIFSSRGAVKVGFRLACIASYQVEPLTLFKIIVASLPTQQGMLNKNYHQIIPILTRGNGYKPGSSKFRPRANAETLYSVLVDLVVVVVSAMGGSKKFSHGMVRSRKPLLIVPLHDNSYYYPTRHLYNPTQITAFNNIPQPLIKSINDLILMNK